MKNHWTSLCAASIACVAASASANTITSTGYNNVSGTANIDLTAAGTADWALLLRNTDTGFATIEQGKNNGSGSRVNRLDITYSASAPAQNSANGGTTFAWTDGVDTLPGDPAEAATFSGFNRYLRVNAGSSDSATVSVNLTAGESGTLSVYVSRVDSGSTVVANIDGGVAEYTDVQSILTGFASQTGRYDFDYTATTNTTLTVQLTSQGSNQGAGIAAATFSVVPEPGSALLMGLGGLAVLRRRNR